MNPSSSHVIAAVPSSNVRIVVLGDRGVGKTSMLQRFFCGFCNDIPEHSPTLEDTYEKSIVVDGENVMLEALDTAPEAFYGYFAYVCLVQSQLRLLVFSVGSRASFDNLTETHARIFSLGYKTCENIVICGKCR
jgi:GTPase SAR1 family protein